MSKLKLGLLALSVYAYAAIASAGTCDFDNCLPPTAVPEPGTFGLLAAGIAAVVAVRMIKRK